MRPVYILSLILLFSFKTFAQCGFAIEGIVKDETGTPLPGASITIISIDKRTVSQTNGYYKIENLCEGLYQVRIQYIGFGDLVVEIKVPASHSYTFQLKPAETVLKNITIEATQEKRMASQTVNVLDHDHLMSLHGKPLGESLKEIPGVSAIQTGPSIFKPVIHGLHSQRILILNNGIRQEGQQWGVEHAPEVDPFIASDIEVVKGAETVRYGSDAIGGVIIINPPPLHQSTKTGGEINLGLSSNNRMGSFSAMLEGNIKKNLSWRVQSSVRRGGDYKTPDYTLSNTGLKELNISGALGFRGDKKGFEFYASSFNTEIGILRAAHTGNVQDIQQSIVNERPWYVKDFTYDINNPRQKINHHLIKASAYKSLEGIGKLTLLYGGQYNKREEYDIRRSGRSSRPSMSMNLLSNVFDVSIDHDKGKHSGSFGINTTFKINENNTEETGIRPLIPNYHQASAGLFVLEKYNFSNITLEAGGRYDYQHLNVVTYINNTTLIKPDYDFYYASGTVGASLHLNDRVRIISNLGISSRPPHVSELFSEGLHHGTASIEEGLLRYRGNYEDKAIKKELSKKWINTLQYTSENISFDFSLYYNAINNYVFIRPYETRLTIRGYFPVFHYEQTDAVLTGGDAGIKWNINKQLSFVHKSSVIYASDKTNDDVLPFIPPFQFDNGVTYSIPQVGVLKDFYLTVNFPYTAKQGRAPRVVYPENIPQDNDTKIFDLAPAPGGYMLINLKAGFNIPVKNNTLFVIMSCENMGNVRYRNYMNRLRYYADETGINFMLRLSYNFLHH